MSRDYKPSPEKPKKTSQGSPLLTGLLIGILLGVGASLSVVVFIKSGDLSLDKKVIEQPKKSLAEKIIEDEKAQTKKADSQNTNDKTRFDFYTILPGNESRVSQEEESKIKAANQPAPVQKSYFLQAGAFQTEEEADNLKAKLALQGFEAVVQTATIPGKGIWHRVRVGPLDDLDKISSIKKDLLSNGFNAELIQVKIENQ